MGQLVQDDLRFATGPAGARDEDLIVWTFLIQNEADAPSTPATLRIEVTYGNAAGALEEPVTRSRSVPAIAAGDAQVLEIATPFRGGGTYRGLAELESAGRVVARATLFFQDCSVC